MLIYGCIPMSEDKSMMEMMAVTPDWGTLAIAGIIGIIFGVMALAWPAYMVAFIGYFIGALMFIYGLITVYQGIAGKDGSGKSALMAIFGIIMIILAILVMSSLFATWMLVTYLIAIWAFMTCFSNLWIAFSGNGTIWYKVFLVIAAIIAFILGVYMIMNPLVSPVIVVWVMGIFALIWGIMLLITGLVGKGKGPQPVPA